MATGSEMSYPISTAPGKMLRVFIDSNLLRRRRDGGLIFGLECFVKRRQFFVDEARKLVCCVGEFALQRLNIRELIVARFAFVSSESRRKVDRYVRADVLHP